MLSLDWLSIAKIRVDEVLLEKWIGSVIREEGLVFGDIALVFCSDDELLEINREHLQHDYYTDIITFDFCNDEVVSGDLFISMDRVRENARDLKLTTDVELYRVIIHGVLHLCGYKDKDDGDISEMRAKEDFYLNKLEGFT